MASGLLEVQLLTPTRTVLKTQAYHVNAPGAYGYIGILPNHAALISELRPGILKIEGGSETKQSVGYKIPGGFVEVANNQVTLLVDSVEPITQS